MKSIGHTAAATGSEFGYVDATGAKRIYQQTFSTRKLGLDMNAAKRLAEAERDRLISLAPEDLWQKLQVFPTNIALPMLVTGRVMAKRKNPHAVSLGRRGGTKGDAKGGRPRGAPKNAKPPLAKPPRLAGLNIIVGRKANC